jgi:hypothetical protein
MRNAINEGQHCKRYNNIQSDVLVVETMATRTRTWLIRCLERVLKKMWVPESVIIKKAKGMQIQRDKE